MSRSRGINRLIHARDRVVAHPANTTAAAWTFSYPAGRVVSVEDETATVKLDDGSIRQTNVVNLTHEKLWRPPQPTQPRRQRPARSLDDGPWVEEALPL